MNIISYLELCLMLVEDAYDNLKKGKNNFAEAQLYEILETFDKIEEPLGDNDANKIIPFPKH